MTFSYQNRTGFGPDRQPRVISWWCPSCSILVQQVKNPVLCDECDGDMTIAPARYQPNDSRITDNPRSKDHAS